MRLQQLLKQATQQLSGMSDSPQLDTELLLAHVLYQNRTWLHAWPEHIVDESQHSAFSALLQRRCKGEPIAYILQQQGFWSLDLIVSADTLIPRPETELLVERALALIPAQAEWHIADLGTGSGAIALALAHERPRCHVIATDFSDAALVIARENAKQHQLERVEFRCGRWFDALPQTARLDMIVSNPPYVARNDPHLHQGDVRYEPHSALVAGEEGLDDLRLIINGAHHFLLDGGWLMLEHGYHQSDPLQQIMHQAGYTDVQDHCDLATQPRLIVGRSRLK